MGIDSLNANGLSGVGSLSQFGGIQGLMQAVNQIVQRLQQLAQQMKNQTGQASPTGAASPFGANGQSDPSQQFASQLKQLLAILQQVTNSQGANGQSGASGQNLQNVSQAIGNALQQLGIQPPSAAQNSPTATGFPQNDVFQPARAAQGVLQQARARELSQALGMDPNAVRSSLQNGTSVQKLASQQGITMKDVKNRLQSQLKADYPGASDALRARIAQQIVTGPQKVESGTGLQKNYPSYPARTLAQQGIYAA
jgi:hypothetical protein